MKRTTKGAVDAQLIVSLRREGRRLTDQRRVILEVVRGTDSHPTADWVHREVKKRVPSVSLGTVYRNLKLLVQQGLLTELTQGHFARFDAKLEGHHHFSCSACGKIFDLDEPVDRRIEARLASRTGFEVMHHRIEFFGRCSACARRRSGQSRRG